MQSWLGGAEVGAEIRAQLAESAESATREEAREMLRSWLFGKQDQIGDEFRMEQFWGFLSPLLAREERDLPSHDDLMALQSPLLSTTPGLLDDDDAPAPLPSFGHAADLLSPGPSTGSGGAESQFKWQAGDTEYNAWEGLLGDAAVDSLGSVVPPSMALFDGLDTPGDSSLLEAPVSSALLDDDEAPDEVPSLSSSQGLEVPSLSSSQGLEVPSLSSSPGLEVPRLPSSKDLEVPRRSSSKDLEVPRLSSNKALESLAPMSSLPLASLGMPSSAPASTKETQIAAAIQVRGDLAEAFGIPTNDVVSKETGLDWVGEAPPSSVPASEPSGLGTVSLFTPESLAPLPPPRPAGEALGPATQMELDAAFDTAFDSGDPLGLGESAPAPSLPPPPSLEESPFTGAELPPPSQEDKLFAGAELPPPPTAEAAPAAEGAFQVPGPMLHPMTPSAADLDVVVGAPMASLQGPPQQGPPLPGPPLPGPPQHGPPAPPVQQAAPLMLKRPVGNTMRTPQGASYIKGPASEVSPHSDLRIDASPDVRLVPKPLRMEDTGALQLPDELVAAFDKKPSATAQFVRIGLILLAALLLVGGALGLYFHFQ